MGRIPSLGPAPPARSRAQPAPSSFANRPIEIGRHPLSRAFLLGHRPIEIGRLAFAASAPPLLSLPGGPHLSAIASPRCRLPRVAFLLPPVAARVSAARVRALACPSCPVPSSPPRALNAACAAATAATTHLRPRALSPHLACHRPSPGPPPQSTVGHLPLSGPPRAYLRSAPGAPKPPLTFPSHPHLSLALLRPLRELLAAGHRSTPPTFAPPPSLLRRQRPRLRHRKSTGHPVRTSPSPEPRRNVAAAFTATAVTSSSSPPAIPCRRVLET